MALSYRDMLNRVLRAVGEDEVASGTTELSESYHKLIGVFINQFKEEIEEAHQWRDLLQQHVATVAADSNDAVITDANERSRLQRMETEGEYVPVVFDVTDPTNPCPLQERPLAEINWRIAIDYPGECTAEPSFFALFTDGDGDLNIRVYPKPTTPRSLTLQMYTPQPRLEDDDLDTVIKIPARPLEFAAIWYAMQERGEELGASGLFTEERFRNALNDAIARDSTDQGAEYTLQVV